MLSKSERQSILALMHREVVPAVGCTEPVCVALCTARACELLKSSNDGRNEKNASSSKIIKIDASLSGNMLKNAMGVGIPGTGGMTGLPIAIALGAVKQHSERGLEVLENVVPSELEEAKSLIDDGRINISHYAEPHCDKLYVDVTVWDEANNSGRAVISGSHTHFVALQLNGHDISYSAPTGEENTEKGQSSYNTVEDPQLTLMKVWEFASDSPLEELRFILDARELNLSAAEYSFEGHYGHALGATLRRPEAVRYFGDTRLAHMIALTSGAVDARMGGAPVAVMSNSGSGNQGITATMPVVSLARDLEASEEQTIRALAASHLTSIYIKQSLGRLSALCGCVVAATGASVGMVMLMGGQYRHAAAAVKNMVANLAGMLCDGAKPSCSLKVSSGVTTALMSAILAMEGEECQASEGIVCDDVDQTVKNLTAIGRDAMEETDRLVLKMMTDKKR